jgi:two-component system phosphate regulon sensor histidine kinase PhoR
VGSRLFWRLFAGFAVVIAAMAVLTTVLVEENLDSPSPGEAYGTIRFAVAVGAALALALAALVSWWLARRILVPIRAVTETAAAVAAGEHGRRVPVASADEIGRLEVTFNAMADQLRDRMETIASERRELRALLAGMVEGVVAVDRNERVVLMNEAARRILGGAEGPSEGKLVWEVTRLREVGETLSGAVKTGTPQVREARLPRTPRDRFLRLHAAPIGDGAGAVLVVHDISELRHLEMVRRDFVANVSHELKTPLAAVRGFVETILDDDAMEPQTRRRFLDRIREQTLRLIRMVEELLSLSRVESAESEVARAPTDVRLPVREAAHALARAAEEKGIALRTELPETPVVVRANDEALRRIAGNLLDNAVKYTPGGGSVTVRVQTGNGEARIEVEDTGPGIPERDRERVFERFYRVDTGGGAGASLFRVRLPLA